MARKYFVEGYNCCQAVVLAFAPELGLERETALKISSSFGGGMGRLREVCGAVSAMFMIEGALDGYTDAKATTEKAEHYKRIQELATQFKARNNSIVCRELLGKKKEELESYVPSERNEEYYKMRPCEKMVFDAAEILEELIAERKINKPN